jgi:hypothetical protein
MGSPGEVVWFAMLEFGHWPVELKTNGEDQVV